MNEKNQDHYFISCPRHCEKFLKEEFESYDFKILREENGGFLVTCETYEILRFMLNSRIASKVYIKVSTIKFTHEKQLAKKAQSVFWNKYMTPGRSFKIQTLKAPGVILQNPFFAGLCLKDGICDYFMAKSNKRPNVDIKYADVNILLYISRSREGMLAHVYIDLSGALDHRGYRTSGHMAPLRENLAAAIIQASEWGPDQSLTDLMCGTGTLLIEAALIKADIPPTYLKILSNYVFPIEKLSIFKKEKNLQRELEELKDEVLLKYQKGIKTLTANAKIIGVDDNRKAISVAKECLKKANLENCIDLVNADALRYVPEITPDIVLCNPPYGQRLGEIATLEKLYYNLGEHLKGNFQGAKAYIFTANLDLRKQISLRTSKRIEFFNGALPARLLEYELF